ncbi:MAG: hypothetical protein ACRDBG_06505 [Waterburya sp.]
MQLKNTQLAYELAKEARLVAMKGSNKTPQGQYCFPHTLQAIMDFTELILNNSENLSKEPEKTLGSG